MKCVACGSVVLVEGTMDFGGSPIAFMPAAVSTLKGMFGVGTRKIRAYGCLHCHHLQFAVDFNEKELQRYQQFEGEQPGILERINSEPNKLKE